MPKINQEEYEILKRLIEPLKKFKQYIARDEDGMLYAYRVKPTKYTNQKWVDGYQKVGVQIDLFQFIQWEDDEPYNIAELIEEYEHKEFYDYVGWKYAESEETEVKKDIDWLKREIHKELEDWHGVEGGIDGDGINEIMLLINQHEESEVKRLYRKMKELESYNDELIRDNNQLRNAMDNQEVLSQEWIDERKVPIFWTTEKQDAVRVEDLQNLLVPKQELPAIPKFVADYLKWAKEKLLLAGALSEYWLEEYDNDQVFNYLYENKDNQELFARAWLDGFSVEEEQKYYAKIKGWELFVDFVGTQYWGVVSNYGRLGFVSIDGAKERTKDEWKRLGINDTNADFVKVEELEE